MDDIQIQYAWAAGFIDGEGTISIKRCFRYKKDGSKYLYYQPFVSLSQAVVGGHEKGVIKMQELFNGSISNWHQKGTNPFRYPTMQWSVWSLDAQKCIEAIYPYLVIKKANADIIKEFFSTRIKFIGGSQKVKMTEEEKGKLAILASSRAFSV